MCRTAAAENEREIDLRSNYVATFQKQQEQVGAGAFVHPCQLPACLLCTQPSLHSTRCLSMPPPSPRTPTPHAAAFAQAERQSVQWAAEHAQRAGRIDARIRDSAATLVALQGELEDGIALLRGWLGQVEAEAGLGPPSHEELGVPAAWAPSGGGSQDGLTAEEEAWEQAPSSSAGVPLAQLQQRLGELQASLQAAKYAQGAAQGAVVSRKKLLSEYVQLGGGAGGLVAEASTAASVAVAAVGGEHCGDRHHHSEGGAERLVCDRWVWGT
jgi:hypothetical protein